MPSLIALLNQGREQISVTRMVDPFDVIMGPIPKVVPMFRDSGKAFAGGKIVLAERLGALRSGDEQQIGAWGNNYYDLADACITFEDLLKAQPDSPLLKGIRGVVENSDGTYAAVDAEAVSKATKNDMRYFQVSGSEIVAYGTGDNGLKKQVNDVVLLRYARPSHIELTADQFASVDAQSLKRNEFIHGRDMEEKEVVDGEEAIHPVYKALWPAGLVTPLVHETFKFNRKKYDYDTNMGLYLSGEPQGHAQMRAFFAVRLDSGSRLLGVSNVGDDGSRLVGVVENGAVGAAKK